MTDHEDACDGDDDDCLLFVFVLIIIVTIIQMQSLSVQAAQYAATIELMRSRQATELATAVNEYEGKLQSVEAELELSRNQMVLLHDNYCVLLCKRMLMRVGMILDHPHNHHDDLKFD